MENNKSITAVEWLVQELKKSTNYRGLRNIGITHQELIDQAKEMEKKQDKFTNSPIHDKKAIVEMMNELHPKEMAEVVEFIKSKIETYGKK